MSAASEFTLGIGDGRTSSRVLKPPGGGHSNIFAAPEAELPRPRPKYNQQNSSNLNSCMNTVDPNEAVAKIVTVQSPTQEFPSFNNNHVKPHAPVTTNGTTQNGGSPPSPKPIAVSSPPVRPTAISPPSPKPAAASPPSPKSVTAAPSSPPQNGGRIRQPPGGYSSGLW